MVANVRRCTSEGCMVTAHTKGRCFHLDLPVVTVMHQPQREWSVLTLGNRRIASDRHIDVDWSKYNLDNYLMSHCSIVCSVNTT